MKEYICGATGKPCNNPDCFNCKTGEEFREAWKNQPVLHDEEELK